MSVTPSPSIGPNDMSSPSDVDFFRSDSVLEDMEVNLQVSAAPCQHEFDPWNPTSFPVNRPRPKQPGESPLRSPSQKLTTGLSSGSWVGPMASPSTNSISGNSLRSTSRLAFEQDDGPAKKVPVKKIYIIAAAAGVAVALATIIALVVVFGTKNADSGDDGNQEENSGSGGGSITTTTPVVDNPIIIIYAGSWGNWSSYSSCPVTCGGGYRTRVRDCLTEPCVGVNTQSESCNDDRCPPDAIYGTWGLWADWNGCGKTCDTGTQFRDRQCVKESVDDEDCVGDPYQTRDCNDFVCPDCSKTCENGTLSSDCTHCECGENLYARVISGGILLADVTISPIETPTAVIAQTGADGMLNLTDQCLGADYIIQKDGYISIEISTSNLGTNTLTVIDMAVLKHLSITTHPQDRMRLLGESATLCCESSGNPPASYYEWLRDGNIVATTSGGTSSTFEFTSLSLADAGYYNCRANNDYGAIVSSEAHINVKESADDFCIPTPQSHVITLPDGCLYNDESYFDVGECSPVACRGGDPDTGECADEQDNAYCCGPLTYAVLEILCEDDEGEFALPVNMVKDCGCVLCPEPQLSVAGTAYGNETLLKQGDIIHNGTVIAQTTENGTFEFNVAIGTERLSLLFKDTVNNILLDTVYVVDFPRGAEGMYYITVLMLSAALTVQVDSSDEASIELPSISNASEPIATVTIPPDSFVSADGSEYTGPVNIAVGVVDPEDLTSLESATGDFSAVGENGEAVQLESSGMMSFGFTDADGNPLAVNADVEIAIPVEDDNVVLWSMNTETGNWEKIGDLSPSRKKSDGEKVTKLEGIKYDTTWYNFDKIQDAACYVKVRVFETADFYEDEQVSGAQVSVIIKTKKKGKRKGTRSLSRVRPYSDKDDKNGYCVIVPCESYRSVSDYEYQGWVLAHYNGNRLKPINITENPSYNENGLTPADQTYGIEGKRRFYKVDNIILNSADTVGPFYDWNEWWKNSPKCSKAPFTDKHFRFSANICYKEFDLITYTTKAKDNCTDQYYLLWHGLPSLEIIGKPYRIAFIKVFTSGMYDAKVIAVTRVRNQRTTSDMGKKNTMIGSRKDCIDNYYQMVCMEFKPPSEIGCSLSNTVNETEVTLVVRVKGGHKVAAVNPALAALAGDDIRKGQGKNAFRMFVKDHNYGSEYGIYIAEHTDREIAKRQAKRMCLGGTDDPEANTDTTSDNWAVQFDNCKDETNIVIAIGEYSRHFYASTMGWVKTNLKALLTDADVLELLSEDSLRVSLIDSMYEHNHETSVIIPLTSERSMALNISEVVEEAITEEWYEWDVLTTYYYDYYSCYDYTRNYSLLHFVKGVIDDAPNSEANTIVILFGDYFDCDWCICYDSNEVLAVANEIKKDARIIQVKSRFHETWWDHHYGSLVLNDDRFAFNETEAMINRVKSYGCIYDEE